MKGGLTSGLVYPGAVKKIAGTYRFFDIGGASAGAIAAVASAAAEYRRQEAKPDDDPMTGFNTLEDIPKKLGNNLVDLFNPTPPFRPVYNYLVEKMKLDRVKSQENSKTSGVKKAGLRARVRRKLRLYFKYIQISFLPIGISILIGLVLLGISIWNSAWGFVLLFLLLVITAIILLPILKIKTLLKDVLPSQHFGMCMGLNPKGEKSANPILMDWICDEIDRIAFGDDYLKDSNRVPLIVADIKKHDISVRAMTSDISSRRPYELPLKTEIFFFKYDEFEKLFPPYMMNYLCGLKENKEKSKTDYLRMPVDDQMPLAMIARMSLSFPVLISAVPLYRMDYKRKDAQAPMSKCLFSDGGISSNFPVHFFDTILPIRPTFGISLGVYDSKYQGDDDKINLPSQPPSSSGLRIATITNLASFIGSIFNTSKDWSDTLQSRLAGVAERVVTIYLNSEKEGGLNLDMDETTINSLEDLGVKAGEVLLNDYDHDEIRRRQALVALPLLEDLVVEFSDGFSSNAINEGHDYTTLIQNDGKKYNNLTKEWREERAVPFADALSKIGKDASGKRKNTEGVSDSDGLPATDAKIMLTALADRTPKK